MFDQKDLEKILKNLYIIDICRKNLNFSTVNYKFLILDKYMYLELFHVG